MEKMHVVLECDGKTIPLNPFVQKFLAGTILGMIGSLDEVGKKPRQVYLAVRKEAKK